MTYPVSTDRYVHNEVEWLLGNGGPNSSVVDLLSGDSVVLLAVHVPSHGLLAEIAVAAVELQTPDMVLVVVEARAGDQTFGLLTSAAGVLVAVDDTEDSLLTVNVLEEIDFSTACTGEITNRNSVREFQTNLAKPPLCGNCRPSSTRPARCPAYSSRHWHQYEARLRRE